MKCPYCGETIPEKSDTCPACNKQLPATQAQPALAPAEATGNDIPAPKVNKGKSSVLLIVSIVVIVLLAAGGGAWWWMSSNNKADDTAEDEEETETITDTLRNTDDTANSLDEQEVPLRLNEEQQEEVAIAMSPMLPPVKAKVGKYAITIVLAREGKQVVGKNEKGYDGYLYYDSQGENAKLWLSIRGGSVYEYNDEGMNTGKFLLYQDIMNDGSVGQYIRQDGKTFPLRFPNGGEEELFSRVAQTEYAY